MKKNTSFSDLINDRTILNSADEKETVKILRHFHDYGNKIDLRKKLTTRQKNKINELKFELYQLLGRSEEIGYRNRKDNRTKKGRKHNKELSMISGQTEKGWKKYIFAADNGATVKKKKDGSYVLVSETQEYNYYSIDAQNFAQNWEKETRRVLQQIPTGMDFVNIRNGFHKIGGKEPVRYYNADEVVQKVADLIRRYGKEKTAQWLIGFEAVKSRNQKKLPKALEEFLPFRQTKKKNKGLRK